MCNKKRIVAMLLSLLLVVSLFIGNTDLAGVTQVFAATVNAPENLSLGQTDKGLTIKWDSFQNLFRWKSKCLARICMYFHQRMMLNRCIMP